jgi:peptidoglycan/xylan/chitin deacetylase (PgdA/CDA1 family)
VADYEEAERELRESKRILEKKLNKETCAIAWPWGIYDENVVDIAKNVGYKFCFTTERGWNRDNFCCVKRLVVSEKKSMFWFKTKTLLYAF